MRVQKPAIPEATLSKWQRIVDIAARIAEVPSGLVMKTDPPDHSVLATSNTDGNPYAVGTSFELNSKLYCHSVLERYDELVVRDARADPRWADNQDMEHGMSFYVGHPLQWPDGELFGTICVLDRHGGNKALLHRDLLVEFRHMIEGDLALLVEIAARKRLEKDLHASVALLEARVSLRTRELTEANTALRVLLSQVELSRLERDDDIMRQIKGLVLPLIDNLRNARPGTPAHGALVDVLEANLKQITSSFADRLTAVFASLTPTEVEIAELVMVGKSSKEIARTLSRERSTIDFHRNNIRKKLNLGHRSQNLRSYFLSLG